MSAMQVMQQRHLPKSSTSVELSLNSSSSLLPSIVSGRFTREPESQQIASPLITGNGFTSKIAQISSQVRSNSKSRSAKRDNSSVGPRASSRNSSTIQSVDASYELKSQTSSSSIDYGIPSVPSNIISNHVTTSSSNNNDNNSNNNNNDGSATFSIKVAVRIRPFNDREVQTYRAAKMIKAREERILAAARAVPEQDDKPALKNRSNQANLLLKELLKDVSGLTNANNNSILFGGSGGNCSGGASSRVSFEKQLRQGAANDNLSARLNISNLITQSLLPNKSKHGAPALGEISGKDLEKSLRSLVEREIDGQLSSNNINIFDGGGGFNSIISPARTNEINENGINVSSNNNNNDVDDINDEPIPIIDVETDAKTVVLLDPFHPGKAKGLFTFDFVVSSFAPSVEITDSADFTINESGHNGNTTTTTNNDNRHTQDKHNANADKTKNKKNALLRYKEKENKAETEQLVLYNELALPLVDVLLRGYNACVFAYGQTSSGKTYTMFGTREIPGIVPRMCKELFQRMTTNNNNNNNSITNSDNETKKKEKKKKENAENNKLEEEELEEEENSKLKLAASLRTNSHFLSGYTVVMSYLEIYNEQVRDLLHDCSGAITVSPSSNNGNNNNNDNDNINDSTFNGNTKRLLGGTSSGSSGLSGRRGSAHMNFSTSSAFGTHLPSDNYDGRILKVRTHPTNGVFVEGLSTFSVTSFEECDRLLRHGNTARTSSATAMNATSSRSHAILQLTITKKEELQGCKVRGQTVMLNNQVSKLNLVDLAGSERSNVDELPGSRHRIETNNINVSLSTLRRVIESLVSRSQASHISNNKTQHLPPYRESVLTYLLSDNFGGNSRTVMCATVSPSEMNLAETESTLRYAAIARGIRLHVKVNESPAAKLIKSLQARVALLSNELTTCMTNNITLERLREIGVNPDNYTNGKYALDGTRSAMNINSNRNSLDDMHSISSSNEQAAYWKNEASRQRRRADELQQQLMLLSRNNKSDNGTSNRKPPTKPNLTLNELTKISPRANDKLALPNLRTLAMPTPMFQPGRVTPISLMGFRAASDLKAFETPMNIAENNISNNNISNNNSNLSFQLEQSDSKDDYLLNNTRLPQFPSSSPCSSLQMKAKTEKEQRNSVPSVTCSNNTNNKKRNSSSSNKVPAQVESAAQHRRTILKPSLTANNTNGTNSDSNNDLQNEKNILVNRRVRREASNDDIVISSPRNSLQVSFSLDNHEELPSSKSNRKTSNSNAASSQSSAEATNKSEASQWNTEAVLKPPKTKKEMKKNKKKEEPEEQEEEEKPEENTKSRHQRKTSKSNEKRTELVLSESTNSSMLENSSDEGVFEPVKKQIKDNSMEAQLLQFQRAKMKNGLKK